MTKKRKTIQIFFIVLIILSGSVTSIATGNNNLFSTPLQTIQAITDNTLIQQNQTIENNKDTQQVNNITRNYWAVLIGLNNYPGTENDLPFSVSEITSFQNTLLASKNWQPAHIKILIDNNATNASIIDAIQWLDENEDSNDVSIFYFTGHGSCDTYGHEYIRIFDAKITDETLDTLLDTLEGQVIVILDSCKSGGFIEELHQNNRIILTACGKDELAYQDYNLGSGIFGYFLNNTLHRLVKSAEIAYLITYHLVVLYTKKISKEYNYDYTFHPAKADNTIGLTKIITWRTFQPASFVNMTAILNKLNNLKIWIL